MLCMCMWRDWTPSVEFLENNGLVLINQPCVLSIYFIYFIFICLVILYYMVSFVYVSVLYTVVYMYATTPRTCTAAAAPLYISSSSTSKL